MKSAGLIDVRVESRGGEDVMDQEVQDPLYKRMIAKLPQGSRPSDFVASVNVTARKAKK